MMANVTTSQIWKKKKEKKKKKERENNNNPLIKSIPMTRCTHDLLMRLLLIKKLITPCKVMFGIISIDQNQHQLVGRCTHG
jgi:hypothetical protein